MEDGNLYLKYINFFYTMNLEVNCAFVIIKNDRLDFENSFEKIYHFFQRKIDFLGVKKAFYLENINELQDFIKSYSDDLVDYIVVIDIMSPFFDYQIISPMIDKISNSNSYKCISKGSIPGCDIKSVISLKRYKEIFNGKINEQDLLEDDFSVYFSDYQKIYNNQLNLYKFKLLKLFLTLNSRIVDLHKYSVNELMALLDTKEYYELMISFGEDVKLYYHDECPHCKSKLDYLYNQVSQPICGYLSSRKPHYSECQNCGLVVASPYIDDKNIGMLYDKWDKQDFIVSTNNPFNSQSKRCDFSKIINVLPKKCNSLDLGGGVGNFSKYLSSEYPDWNVTHSDFSIKANIEGDFNCIELDFVNNPIGNNIYDLITAWEVVEHIPFKKLENTFSKIWESLNYGGFFVFSTPDFDSPLCRNLDFFSMGLPFHYTVLGQKWITNFVNSNTKFEIFDVKHCSDFLDDSINWFSYAEATSPNVALSGTYKLLKKIFELDHDDSIKNNLLAEGFGTEVIFTLRKI